MAGFAFQTLARRVVHKDDRHLLLLPKPHPRPTGSGARH
jgi:hypothetical protein